MYFLLFIVILFLLVVFALFEKPSHVLFLFDTDQNAFFLLFHWLNPLLVAKVEMVNYFPCLSIFFLHKQIYLKKINRHKRAKSKAINVKNLSLQDSYLTASYGLNNPFSTSMVNGIIEMICPFIQGFTVSETPDYLADHEYILFKAETDLNIGKTLAKMIRLKFQNSKRSDNYGSIEYN